MYVFSKSVMEMVVWNKEEAATNTSGSSEGEDVHTRKILDDIFSPKDF